MAVALPCLRRAISGGGANSRDLDGTLGNSDVLGEFLIADLDGAAAAGLLGGDPKIDQKPDGAAGPTRSRRSKGVQFEVEPQEEDWGTTAGFRGADENTFVPSTP